MANKTLILLLVLGQALSFAQTESKVLVATGKEVRVEVLAPGTVTCEGGTPTGAVPPCTPGTKSIKLKGMSNKYVAEDLKGTAAALLGGANITQVSASLDANWYGHMWGTAEWTVPDMEGVWQGTFSAVADQAKGFLFNRAIFYGSGGKLKGLKMEFFGITVAGDSSFMVIVTAR